MGIQMGNDGRFYASMGGVRMPNSSTAESSEEMKQNSATSAAFSPKMSKGGKESLLTCQKLTDKQGSYQNYEKARKNSTGANSLKKKSVLNSSRLPHVTQN